MYFQNSPPSLTLAGALSLPQKSSRSQPPQTFSCCMQNDSKQCNLAWVSATNNAYVYYFSTQFNQLAAFGIGLVYLEETNDTFKVAKKPEF